MRTGLLAVAVLFAPVAAAEERAQLLSYEALPSAQMALDLSDADYEERAQVTAAVMEQIAPDVIAAAGFDPATVATEMTPGGYELTNSASLQARAVMSDDEATRLAAGIGYVFRQWSVLVSELDDASGGTAYVTVAFPAAALTPTLAHAFFVHAASVDGGLGGGYTAFGDEMIFLNVQAADGVPYSGLNDTSFAAQLGLAAGSFEPATLDIRAAGTAEARFVENDWDAAPNGEHYAALLDDADLIATLDALRAQHTTLIEAMGASLGWR